MGSPAKNERIAIVGARAHPNAERALRPLIDSLPRGTTVISGGAAGIDMTAREIALVNELSVIEYVIVDAGMPTAGIVAKHWQGLARSPRTKNIGVRPDATARDLLIFRNTWIAISCDRAYAFLEGTRGGTADAVEQFARFFRPCEKR